VNVPIALEAEVVDEMPATPIDEGDGASKSQRKEKRGIGLGRGVVADT
jgi:hypothetical protein